PPPCPPPRVAMDPMSRLPFPLSRSPFPAICVALPAVVQPHKPAEPAHPRAHQREQRPSPEPTVDHPAERAERENGEREAEAQRDVGVAFAEAPAEAIWLVGWHDADGNIRAGENFRKQSHKRATLCRA